MVSEEIKSPVNGETLKDGVAGMLESVVVLSPMAGVTDAPFRLMCRKYGCRFAFTEMVDVNGISYRNAKTMRYLDMAPGDHPLGAQIVGEEVQKMLEAAVICQDKGFKVVDINAGCPARKVIKGGKGSALLKSPARLGKIIGTLASKLKVDVTVKIRSGWDDDNINYIEVAKISEAEGAKAICVHPRTRTQMYRGAEISHEPTREVKQAVKIPVFASGNIFSPEAVKDVMKKTGCDGVFVARGCLGHPWIFRNIYRMFDGAVEGEEPSFDDIKSIISEHFKLSERYYGEFLSGKRMYKHISWYLKKYKGLNAVMNAYRGVKDSVSLSAFLDKLKLDGRHLVI